MARVKRGVIAHARHKKVLEAAKGYYGARSRTYRVAVQAVTKAGQYAIATVVRRSVSSVSCGLFVSMPLLVSTT